MIRYKFQFRFHTCFRDTMSIFESSSIYLTMNISGLLFAIFGYFYLIKNQNIFIFTWYNVVMTSYDMSVKNKFPKTQLYKRLKEQRSRSLFSLLNFKALRLHIGAITVIATMYEM